VKILVTTPMGQIGRRILGELLAPEFSVRVIARNPDRLPQDTREQVEVIRGSMDDVGTLRTALEGIDSMFWCVPKPALDESNVRGHFERFARAGAQAIRLTGTSRVVTISALGKGLAGDAGPLSGLHVMEDILGESGAALRHLRCGPLMENLLWQVPSIIEDGILTYPMSGNVPVPMVALSDVADVALKYIVRADWKGVEAMGVVGPEPVSLEQAAKMIERTLGRPVGYEEMAVDLYVQSLIESGASAAYARGMAAMFAVLEEGNIGAEPGLMKGRTSTRLATWIERELLPLPGAVPLSSKVEVECDCVCGA
jgi:uncharacterized protein YbjT (DUF2867 family)